MKHNNFSLQHLFSEISKPVISANMTSVTTIAT